MAYSIVLLGEGVDFLESLHKENKIRLHVLIPVFGGTFIEVILMISALCLVTSSVFNYGWVAWLFFPNVSVFFLCLSFICVAYEDNTTSDDPPKRTILALRALEAIFVAAPLLALEVYSEVGTGTVSLALLAGSGGSPV